MRHRDGDDSDGDSRSTVRFTSTPQESSGLRERVLDTEDAARGPLSGIFRLTDSPRVMRKLQEYERAGKRKKEEPPPHPVQQPQPPKPQVNWTIRQFHPLRWSRTDDGWIFNEHFFFSVKHSLFPIPFFYSNTKKKYTRNAHCSSLLHASLIWKRQASIYYRSFCSIHFVSQFERWRFIDFSINFTFHSFLRFFFALKRNQKKWKILKDMYQLPSRFNNHSDH